MTKLNLRDFYPSYNADCIVEVPDEVAAVLFEAERKEEAHRRRMYRYKAQYSLDRGDGIENDICLASLSPYEIYERKLTMEQLSNALKALPHKQSRRVYAHYILGISQTDIARAEGVDARNIRKSISKALRSIGKIFQDQGIS